MPRRLPPALVPRRGLRCVVPRRGLRCVVPRRGLRCVVLAVLAALSPAVATAEPHAAPSSSPFDRHFALASYATGHAGNYRAAGLGGRIRWEVLSWLGLEAYLEATLVDWPGALRHDYPNGFNAFVPIRLGKFRVRPYLGFCDILSFIEPAEAGAPRADDVLFGAHAGVGAEWGASALLSFFTDLQVNGYVGHDRTAGQWTGGVDESMDLFWNVQLNIGVQMHFWPRA